MENMRSAMALKQKPPSQKMHLYHYTLYIYIYCQYFYLQIIYGQIQ